MKVPLSLQYALTRNHNRYLVKNLNKQVFTKDPANVFGRFTARDVGLLRGKARYVEPNADNSKLVLVTKRRRGRVTKRKGKRSQVTAPHTSVSRKEFTSVKDMGSKACRVVLWKIVRAKRAQRRASKIAALAN